MLKVILSGHGKTDWNENNLLCGITDEAKLTSVGVRQSLYLSKFYGLRRDINEIFCSPLTRALQTVQPLANCLQLPITIVPELRDINFGDFDRRQINDYDVAEILLKAKNDLSFRFPNGESYLDMIEQARHFVLQKIAPYQKVKTAIYVQTHSAKLRSILAILMGVDLSVSENFNRIVTDNSIVYEVDFVASTCCWIDLFSGKEGAGLKLK